MNAGGLLVMACLCTGLPAAPDFDTQIVPLFTKAGCNAAACHGAAAGRGGFKLSLWGLNPASDHLAIVHQYEGRRINLVRSEQSLLLLKSSGLVEHGGEAALEDAPDGEQRLIAWIRAGARRSASRHLQQLEISPHSATVSQLGAE